MDPSPKNTCMQFYNCNKNQIFVRLLWFAAYKANKLLINSFHFFHRTCSTFFFSLYFFTTLNEKIPDQSKWKKVKTRICGKNGNQSKSGLVKMEIGRNRLKFGLVKMGLGQDGDWSIGSSDLKKKLTIAILNFSTGFNRLNKSMGFFFFFYHSPEQVNNNQDQSMKCVNNLTFVKNGTPDNTMMAHLHSSPMVQGK